MPYEIRPIVDDELEALSRMSFTAFGEELTDEIVDDERAWFEADRSLAVVEDGTFVASAGAYSFDLTLPGLATIPVAGVTWVAVLPTHRRQGLLTAMMDRQLDDVAERGEAVAVLTASEAVIYNRFGYGCATRYQEAEINIGDGLALIEPSRASGRLRLVQADEARKIMPAVNDAWRRQRPGALSRSDRWWELYFRDRDRWRNGATSRYYVVHETDGVADGVAAYRVKETWSSQKPGNDVVVEGTWTTDPEVEVALWRYLFDLDLIDRGKAKYRPLDDWLPWRMVDRRRYRETEIADWLWARLVDIPAALSARTYENEASIVLEVADRFRPANDGRYRLDGGPDGATCTRLDATAPEPDLSLTVEALGSLYLGDVTPSVLVRAGRAVPASPESLARADSLFAASRKPFCDLGF